MQNQFSRFSSVNPFGSKLILCSFSGGGSMVARMVGYAPDRILAAIEYPPGHYEPIYIDTVKLPEAALSVPQFIIANGADNIGGTQRPYAYFERYHDRAPLTSMVQNRVPHCCVMNVTPMAMLWLADVIAQQTPSADKPLVPIDREQAWQEFIQVEVSSVKDDWREPVWNAGDAWIVPPVAPCPRAHGTQDGCRQNVLPRRGLP